MNPAGSHAAPARVLLFDVFGTVVDWRGSVIAEGERLARLKDIRHVDWAAFADAWRGGYRPSMDRVRSGELPWTRLDDLHRMTLDELLPQFQVGSLTDDDIARLNLIWHRLDPWADAVEGLTRLKSRYVIAPLSNGNLSLLTDLAKYAKLPWDCVLSTELVRRYKPDPDTYLMAADFFSVAPSALVMVAAHESDLEAARALGLRTAYVHRPREFGPGHAPVMPPPGRFDHQAADFLELADLLGA
jgi:2-haloacid dehalogenase